MDLRRSLLLVASLTSLTAACGSETPSAPADAATAITPTDAAVDAPVTDVAPMDVSVTDAPVVDGPAVDVPPSAPRACNPLAITAECLPPFPSDLLTQPDTSTPTGRRLALPDDALTVPSGSRPIDVAPFNRADGWPTSIPILAHLGVALRDSDLVDIRHPERSVEAMSPIAVFDMATGRRVPFLSEMDANARDPARAALIVRTLEPLDYGSRYVVAIRRSVRTRDGAEPPPSPGFVALRDRTSAPSPAIEAARARFEEVFTFLASHGYAREDLYLAWDWTTASRQHVLGPILSMRDEVARRAATPSGLSYTITRVEEDPNPNVARIVYGTFSGPNYLRADNSLVFDASGRAVVQPETRSDPFTMIVPARARTATAPMPLSVFGHGVFGRGEEYLSGSIGRERIQPLAQELGTVVIATDWIGLSGGDLSLLISQVVPDINRITLVTDRLLQAVTNNLAMTELGVGALSRDPRVRFTGELVDPSRVYYYGVSLGGIQGSSFVSVSPRVTRAVVSVPGASWANLLPRSTVYGQIKPIVDARYPDPLLQAQFIGLLQFRFDHTDGVNLARLAFREPLPGAPADRRVILQEAIGDCQVPNIATRILSRAFGARQFAPFAEAVYGLEPATSPVNASGAVLAQFLLPEHLGRYTPPDTNTVPTMDNGTHSDAVATESAFNQLRELIRSGSVTQPCDGACDPD